jgi:hypothetical protein
LARSEPADPATVCFSLLQMAQWRSPNPSLGEWDVPVVNKAQMGKVISTRQESMCAVCLSWGCRVTGDHSTLHCQLCTLAWKGSCPSAEEMDES